MGEIREYSYISAPDTHGRHAETLGVSRPHDRSGKRTVRAAKKDGSWAALDAVEALIIPADLQVALAGYPQAGANFDGFPRSAKRSILEWISSAKKPETRTKRIEDTARLAADNIRANQWPR